MYKNLFISVGVETSSFPFNHETNSYYMKENLVLEGISKQHIQNYVSQLLLVGTYYRRLYKFAFNETLEDHFHSNGLVYEVSSFSMQCVKAAAPMVVVI